MELVGHAGPVDWIKLGQRIRAVWRASKVPQGVIVEKLDIERQTMGAWMRGDRHPTTTNLEKFADVIQAELVIDFIHPAEDTGHIVGSRDAVEAARLVDDLPPAEHQDLGDPPLRVKVLRFLRVAHALDAKDWGNILNIVAFAEREVARHATPRQQEL